MNQETPNTQQRPPQNQAQGQNQGSEPPAPVELEEGKWYRCWLTDIDLEEHPEYGLNLHWVWGTVAKFQDGKRRYIKFCRTSNKLPAIGAESDMYMFGKDGTGSMMKKILTSAKNESKILDPDMGMGGVTITESSQVEDLKSLFYKAMVLIQVTVVEKNGKVYGNFAAVKPVPWDKNRTNEQRRTSEQGAQQRRQSFGQQRRTGGKWTGNRGGNFQRPQQQRPAQQPQYDDSPPPDELF